MTHSVHWLTDARFSAIVRPHLVREHEAIERYVGGEGPDPDDG
jgi:hypothetical protein